MCHCSLKVLLRGYSGVTTAEKTSVIQKNNLEFTNIARRVIPLLFCLPTSYTNEVT